MDVPLIMLCPYWPPHGGPGVQRPLKFARYLPEYGVEPFVVTRRNRPYEDESLLSEARGIAVREAAHLPHQTLARSVAGGRGGAQRFAFLKRVRDWLFVPDAALTWVPFASHAGIAWAQELTGPVLYSTSPYASAHLAGLIIKRRVQCPWIVEMRDPWVGDAYSRPPTAAHRRLHASLERRVVRGADGIVVVTRHHAEKLAERYPSLESKIEIIYNGFDDADFTSSVQPPPGPPWHIRHIGTLYPGRKADAFLAGYAAFIEKDPSRAELFPVSFYGTLHPDVRTDLASLCERLGLRSVKFHPPVAHTEALDIACRSHVLLLLPGPGESTIPGKLFEYLATGNPILTVGPASSGVNEILGQPGEQSLRATETAEAVAQVLEEVHSQAMKGVLADAAPPASIRRHFTRRESTARLAALVHQLNGRRGRK